MDAIIIYYLSFIIYYLRAAPQRVVPGRVELPTSTLSVWRSNQLSYRTGICVKLRRDRPKRAPGFYIPTVYEE